MKQHIAIFYIALMLLFKVVGLHGLTHDADDAHIQHCEVCDITTAVNFIPLLEADTPDLLKAEYYYLEQKLNSIAPHVVFNNKQFSSHRFTRPPPQFS